jgi:hypothetical protein
MQVDAAFTEQEVCLIDEAAARWRTATGGVADLHLHAGGDGHHWIRVAPQDVSHSWPADRIGAAEAPGDGVWISTSRIHHRYHHRYAEEFLSLTMHELGHHFGLLHGPGLMHEDRDVPCLEQSDLDQFCELHHCPGKLIPPACDPVPSWCGG